MMTASQRPPLLQGITVIVAAAGKGTRFGGEVAKQYLDINGKSVLQHSLERLLALGPEEIVLVVAKDDTKVAGVDITRRCRIVHGGETRALSVLNALTQIDGDEEGWVMVHDAARPCFRAEDVARLVRAAQSSEAGGLLATRVVETVKRADEYGRSVSTENRDALWVAQTPQMFRLGLLRRAMTDAIKAGISVTDEASAVEFAGYRPQLIEGARSNIKVTTPQDLELAAWLLSRTQDRQVQDA